MLSRCAVRLSVLCLAALVDSFGFTLLSNVLPVLVDHNQAMHYSGTESLDTGLGYSILQFAYCLGVTISAPAVGSLSDTHGRRPMILICLACVSVAYYLQGLCSSFWLFAVARFLGGIAGGVRPLAMAYIADSVSNECTRARQLGLVNLVPAISVGFGPALGGVLASYDRSYPFMFMTILSFIVFVLALFFLPEARGLRGHSFMASDHVHRGDCKSAYGLVVGLGFSTYFMAMFAALAFPLVLKQDFKFEPFVAGLCGIGDGPVTFIASLVFIEYFNELQAACRASFISSLMFVAIAWVPETAGNSLVSFLSLKYMTSLAGPIIFSSIPQILIDLTPSQQCGKFVGILTCAQGSGRLLATLLVGPLFEQHESIVFYTVALCGVVTAIAFIALEFAAVRILRSQGAKSIPLLEEAFDSAGQTFASNRRQTSILLSRQVSLIYPGSPLLTPHE